MDAERFDALARFLDLGSRRRLLGSLFGTALGALALLLGQGGTGAKPKRKKGHGQKRKKKRKKRPQDSPPPPPPPSGDVCLEGVGAEECAPGCFLGCMKGGSCLQADTSPPQQSDQACGLMGEACVNCPQQHPPRPHCCVGECQECCADAQCAAHGDSKACCAGVCAECFTDAHCAQHPDRPHCAGSPVCACVECTRHTHCPPGFECYLDTFTCQPACSHNTDCLDPAKPICCEVNVPYGNGELQRVHQCVACCLLCDLGDECVTNWPVPNEQRVQQCCPREHVCQGSRTGCCAEAPGGPALMCVPRVNPPSGTPTHACVTS